MESLLKKEGKDDEEERSQGRLSLYIFECTKSILNISGDDYMEEIPVPIPNTEVKLQCADDICGLPCWENRLSPVFLFYKQLWSYTTLIIKQWM